MPGVSSLKLPSSEPLDASPGSLQSWAVMCQHPPWHVTPELVSNLKSLQYSCEHSISKLSIIAIPGDR